MENEIELISDGDGVAVIGSETAVDRFIASGALRSITEPSRSGKALQAGSLAIQGAANVSANSGRWLKLTKGSAADLQRIGLTPTETPGVSHAMLGPRGSIKKWLQVESGPAALATNPALLSGAAGIMAQMAMQQAMDEIVDYLEVIDAKLDSVLRAQTNQVLARLDGVDLAIREATSVRESVGRVSEVTWSKVQSLAQTIHETQGFALRQLSDLADKLNEQSKISDLEDSAKEAETEVQKWMVVLARCFQLQDAVGVLELDRVLDASPEELDRHRLGLQSARRTRVELISESVDYLMERMRNAVDKANSRVLFNPMQSPAVVKSTQQISSNVQDFRTVLELEAAEHDIEARNWSDAASDRWDEIRSSTADGAESAKGSVLRLGSKIRGRTRSLMENISDRVEERQEQRQQHGGSGEFSEPGND